MEELRQCIEVTKAVSFDIFDTLIVRLYRQQTDLFLHLEQSFQLDGFKEARIAAEQTARATAVIQGRHEVTLEEIYHEMHGSYRGMEQEEIQLELQMCKANPEMKAVFDDVLSRNIPIFILSDTYLPRDVIEAILTNGGYYGYQKLLLSSETMRPKATGEMYENLIALAGVPASSILHIGDHYHTDYEAAVNAGLRAYHYETIWRTSGQNQNSAFFAVLNQYVDQNIALSVLEGLTALRGVGHSVDDYWEEFGYKYIGILAYGYIKWLKERLDKLEFKKVYFMLRDGYIMKQVFDILYPEFESYEVYSSNRFFTVSGMKNYSDLKAIMQEAGVQLKGYTYAQFWEWLCLEDQDLKVCYIKMFPNQEQIILNDDLLDELDRFMEQHVSALLNAGEREREAIDAYLKELNLFDAPTAIVDLGLEGSAQKGLERVIGMLEYDTMLTGFYLGARSCDTAGLHMESYLMDCGNPANKEKTRALLDSGFTKRILEVAFSAPKSSVLKVQYQNGKLVPVYQDSSVYEQDRMKISSRILSGVIDFTREMLEIEKVLTVPVSYEATLAPIEYLSSYISRSDQAQIEQALFFSGIGNGGIYRPIFKTGYPVIGVINPWPGAMSAESEVISRLKRTAEEHQIDIVVLDQFGCILDENQKVTSQYIADEVLSFVITTHYEIPKLLNAFYYHGVWNPPEIPLNFDYYTQRIANNYLMNDDYLIYDSGGMSNHLRSILMNCPRTLEGASSLTTTSFPLCTILPPRLDDPVMFYCGMNWERVVHGTNRHEGLFKLLDETQKVKFFGPELVKDWGGLRPWEGYKCYQHSIPFDGFSILKEINQCGICLVLSSDIHRRAGAATNRTYEACAAGAVIISDENEFMLRHFKDAALFIDYNKNNPKDTFRQIMEKYDWIVAHPKEALALATKAQEIFIKKFSLDAQMSRLIENHPARFAQIQKDLYAQDDSRKVLVTFVLNTQDLLVAKPKLEKLFRNVHGQLYRNIELGIAADFSIYNEVEEFSKTRCTCVNIIAMELFDKKGSRRLTDGQAIRQLQKQIAHTYYINANEEELWFFDHVTSMVRAIEDSGALCAYSGSAFQDMEGLRRINCFETLDSGHLYYMSKPERSLACGQFLFHANAHSLVPDFLFDNLDGKEHLAYAGLIHYKYGGKLVFTRRMSLCFTQDEDDSRGVVVPSVMQNRLIQDLIRLDLPEDCLSTGEGVFKKTVSDSLLLMPIKSYICLRYYRFRMRRLATGSSKYKKFEAKYKAALKRYNDFWDV